MRKLEHERAFVIVLMLANERSGTHFLRSALESSGLIEAHGEICNAEAEPAELGFFNFRAQAFARNKKFAIPTVANQGDLLDLYFAFVENYRLKIRKKCIMIDIKYSHIHNFNCFWWDLFSPPFLVEYIQEKRIPVIHLVRTNVFQTAFSDFYAQATGVWRATRTEEVVVSPMTVDIAKLKNKARRIEGNINLMRGWLHGGRALEVHYESIVGERSSDALNEVMKFLRMEIQPKFSSGYVKTTPRYSSIIENFEEVRALVEPGTQKSPRFK